MTPPPTEKAIAGRAFVVGSYAVGLTIRTDEFPVAGETRLGSGYESGPGGKGSNQAIGLARLGVSVMFVGCVGDDQFGADAIALLRSENVDVEAVSVLANAATGVGFIVLDAAGRNLIVLDPGANQHLDGWIVRQWLGLAGPGDVVVAQLEIPDDAAAAAMLAGRAAGATSVLNPAPARQLAPQTLRAIDVLTPNETELRILCGLRPDARADEEQLARALVASGVNAVVVTRGAQGALIVTDADRRSIDAPRVDVVDSTGAGDAFNAALVAGLLAGDRLHEAVQAGVVAGALACTRGGVVPSLPRKGELEAALSRLEEDVS
jgi:ribokinase